MRPLRCEVLAIEKEPRTARVWILVQDGAWNTKEGAT